MVSDTNISHERLYCSHVLILVVMESEHGGSIYVQPFQLRACVLILNRKIHLSNVLILVVMEDGLGQNAR